METIFDFFLGNPHLIALLIAALIFSKKSIKLGKGFGFSQIRFFRKPG